MECKNGEYFLTEKESLLLREQAVRPDKSVMRRRDAFFSQIDKSLTIKYLEDGGMIVKYSSDDKTEEAS